MRIEARQISLIYDIGREEMTYAFKDVDLRLDSRGMTGVCGPSGSGKSSLLYVLSGLRKASSGTVYYDDMDIEAMSADEKTSVRKTRFGFIFQRNFMIEYLTVLDNVLVPLNEAGNTYRQKALELLDRFRIGHLAGRKPFQLSGGQRQRAAAARALINDPEVIFADEPTASLDHRNAMELMDVLGEYRDRAAIIIATHDRSILGKTDRIAELWDGHMTNVI